MSSPLFENLKRILLLFLVITVFQSHLTKSSNLVTRITTNSACSDIIPTTSEDCTLNTIAGGDFCCYVEGIRTYSNEKKCLVVPRSSYTGYSYIPLDGKEYKITCPSIQVYTVLSPCGPADGYSRSTCMTGSSFVNSCCYYGGSSEGTYAAATKPGCYWLGTKYDGNVVWATMSLSCTGLFPSNFIAWIMLIAFLGLVL